MGAVQFSSAPWLEFPLDSLSTQQEVKTKLKRMVFKYVRSDSTLAGMWLAALKIALEGFDPALGLPERAGVSRFPAVLAG